MGKQQITQADPTDQFLASALSLGKTVRRADVTLADDLFCKDCLRRKLFHFNSHPSMKWKLEEILEQY